MAQIDRLIEAAFKYNANSLIMTPGETVALVIGNDQKPVTSKPVSQEQIRSFLDEIAPASVRPQLDSGESCDFSYAAPAGQASIMVLTNGDGSLRLRVMMDATATSSASGNGAGASAGIPTAQSTHSSSEGSSEGSPAGTSAGSSGGTVSAADGPPIERLLRLMVDEGCSDLHLTSGNPPLFRKDGDITQIGDSQEKTAEEVSALISAIMSEKSANTFEETHDVDFAYEIEGLARFRCNVFMDRLGMGGVFRVIPSKIPSAQDLGLSSAILDLCKLHKGLVVVTGPTGSGKSTTLAAMIDSINKEQPRHLITIEDPIEFVHPKARCLINQREVGIHTKGFKHALRAALREDPDIVLVGEMRDLETVAIALETAETGHLVFGTLHTNTAPATVDRIIDQFPPDQQAQIRVLLSESLKGVIAQTLCKRKGGGRVAAQEILIVNAAIGNLIREGKTYQIPSLMQTGKSLGMHTLDAALLDLVQKGVVEAEEAYSKSITKPEFKTLLDRHCISLKAA